MLLAAACTSPVQGPSQAVESPHGDPASFPVELADIVPTLSLAAEVQSHVTYAITAHVAGRFSLDADGPGIVQPDGSRVDVDAPAGTSITTWLVSDGTPVAVGLPLATALYEPFMLVATVVGADLLRFTEVPLGAVAQIDGAGRPFDCSLLDARPTRTPDEEFFVGCSIPEDQPVSIGMTGIVVVSFPGATSVPSLPVEAVAGSRATGTVFRVQADGSAREVPVELGLNDGLRVQIISGLEVGDRVYVPSPSLLNG